MHRHSGALIATAAWFAAACIAPGAASARPVLVESFGSTGCGACPPVRDALALLSGELGNELVIVEYHGAAPLQAPGNASRAAYYGISSEPLALFDGADAYAGGGSAIDSCRTRFGAHAAVPPPISIEAAALFSESSRAGSLLVEIGVGAGGVPSPQEVAIRALFVEDDVECCDPGAPDRWNAVVRAVLEARALQVGGSGQIQFEQWALPLEAGWSVTHLRAVVFLQRDTDRSVLGAAYAADLGGLQPLPLTGLDESRVNLLPCRPNPLRTGETRILFTLPDPGPAKMQVLNAAGRVVRVLTDGPRPEGIHDVRWDGTDYTGRRMATGVYVVRLETVEGVLSRKLTLLR